MASTDWTFMNNGLSGGTVDRGVTNGISRPSGGGNFVYGFHSLATTAGAVALFTNQANFAPMAKGCSIRGAIKRMTSGGPTGFAPFLYALAQGNDITDSAYILGLDDDDPHTIVLRKGRLVDGMPASALGANGVLARSTDSFEIDTWHHLRLDAVVNTNGDVILKCFASDLDAVAVTSPVWNAIDGIDDFIDDALGINSGSQPFTSGRSGYGFQTADVSRRAAFDHIEVYRQL